MLLLVFMPQGNACEQVNACFGGERSAWIYCLDICIIAYAELL